MKRLLVPLLGDSGDRPALDLAATVARSRGAHIDAVLFVRDPRDMIPMVGEGFNATLIESLVEAGEIQARDREKAARETFGAWSQATGISDGLGSGLPSAAFSVRTVSLPSGIARLARAADLVVFARTEADAERERTGLIEVAMFDSGRPVLLAGRSGSGAVGRHVLVGWNGSAEAARAVAMGMPMLSAADAVTVVVVDDGDVTETPDEIVQTFKLWGIAAAGWIEPMRKEGIAATLEAAAVAAKADMILLGAYSHSRVREFVMGGVTDDALTDGSITMMLAR